MLARGLLAFVTSNKAGTAGLQALLGGRAAHSLGLAALRPVTVAHLSKRIATPGAALKVVLKLSSKARKALANARRATLSLKLVVTDAAGRATTLHQKIVLNR